MAPAFHTPRRKDTESDMRTLTEDMPIAAVFVVAPIVAGVWFFNQAMAAGVDSIPSSWMASWQFWTGATIVLGAIWAVRKGRILWAILAVLAGGYILWSSAEHTETAVKPAAVDTPSERHAEAPPAHPPVPPQPQFDYGSLTGEEKAAAKAADHASATMIKEALKRVATHNDNHAGINARIIVFDDPVDMREVEKEAQEESAPAVEAAAPKPSFSYVEPERPTRTRRQEARSYEPERPRRTHVREARSPCHPSGCGYEDPYGFDRRW